MELEVQNNLSQLRRKRGISAAQLASAVGVSRQTIYAIEAETYVPNTVLGLKLAHTLDVRVEEIFSLRQEASHSSTIQTVEFLPEHELTHRGQPLRLCSVSGRPIAVPAEPGVWELPSADAVLAEEITDRRPVKAKATIIDDDWQQDKRILIAGCDPAAALVARCLQRKGVELIVSYQNSSSAMELLKKGFVHIAGTHLPDRKTGASNLPDVVRIFGKSSVAVFSYAVWEEGIVVDHGNPKSILAISDLARRSVRMTNREKGAGCRHLLDSELQKLGIDAKSLKGYDHVVYGHLPAAREVKAKASDCCISTRAAAQTLGLDFVPLATKQYDLVILKSHLALPGIQTLIEMLGQSIFRRELEAATAYDMHIAGNRIL
jgi:molybdate-binding protein/DNA-binding XRE family transcriptional regulator